MFRNRFSAHSQDCIVLMGKITTGDGCHIAYRWYGPEGAPPLILSNSLGTAMGMWQPQMSALTQHFRVLRYDARGHGASSVMPGAYGMERLGRDVVDMMDALGIARASFCGLSMGGMVGQWLGVYAPERLDRLVLANTSAFMGPASGWNQRIALVQDGGMAAIAETVLARWLTAEFRLAHPTSVAPLRDMLLATAQDGYAGCCAAIRDMDLRRVIGMITAPTLVIGGTHDSATPLKDAEYLADQIASSQCVTLPTAHLSNAEQPEAFTAVVLNHLAH